MQERNNRNYGIDIYKILCMFLVIAFHFSDHGTTPLLAGNPLTFNWILLASSRIWGGVAIVASCWLAAIFYQAKLALHGGTSSNYMVRSGSTQS